MVTNLREWPTYYLFAMSMCMHGSLAYSQSKDLSERIDKQTFNTGTVLWYDQPAKEWEEALPVGNGRLGAMVFGKGVEFFSGAF